MDRERIMQNLNMASQTIGNFELARERIMFRIINAEMHEKELQSLVHIPVMNLAVIFTVQFDKFSTDVLCTKISKDLLKYWNVDVQSLWKIAYENTRMKYPATASSMDSFLKRILLCNIADPQEQEEILGLMKNQENNETTELTILSNRTGVFGASCMLYEGALKECAELSQSDLLIFPSSIHEVLLTKYDGSSDVRCFSHMVSSINASEVAEEERLADNVYIYRWKQGLLENSETGEWIRPGYTGIAELLEEMKQVS